MWGPKDGARQVARPGPRQVARPGRCRRRRRRRGVPAERGSLEHPSSVSALRADPPSPTRGEGRGAAPQLASRLTISCCA
ncbi:hypothetical protein D3242_07545 [Mesorhizobium jarvisii]|uniref:Uncharacterized protein n=1 Tax=Mesorhizobium jarvisii TaxID=1777867 RepID=A0AA92XIV0_9HYPH|nr:hypothetical protein D3242_07545 [Mesorhizobium jarvisii]